MCKFSIAPGRFTGSDVSSGVGQSFYTILSAAGFKVLIIGFYIAENYVLNIGKLA